jgi:hypothetical protein
MGNSNGWWNFAQAQNIPFPGLAIKHPHRVHVSTSHEIEKNNVLHSMIYFCLM